MKKFAIVIAALLFSGCSLIPTTTVTAQPPVTVTATPEAPVTPVAPSASPDEVFRKAYPQAIKEYFGVTVNDDAVESAMRFSKTSCAALDSGASAQQIVDRIKAMDITDNGKRLLAFTLGFGVAIYCPEYVEDLKTVQ